LTARLKNRVLSVGEEEEITGDLGLAEKGKLRDDGVDREGWYDEKKVYGLPYHGEIDQHLMKAVDRDESGRGAGGEEGWWKLWDVKGDCREIGTMETYGSSFPPFPITENS